MRIGIDARPLSKTYLGGIGTYLYKILSYADEFLSEEHELVLFSNEDIIHLPAFRRVKNSTVIDGGKPSILWLRYRLPQRLKAEKIDIFWGPNQVSPLKVSGVKQILTVHDLALLINSEWAHNKADTVVQKIYTVRSIRDADVVLTVSNSTKSDILRFTNKNPECIMTTYCGVDDFAGGPVDCQAELVRNMGIGEPYFLYIGDLNKRKNVDTIISAFAKYCTRNRDGVLVLAGGNPEEKYEEYLSQLDETVRNRVKRTGYVDERQKIALYANCLAFVFPSRYEGFGIPVVEAMRAGAVVITACNSSLKEISGDAALLLENVDDSDGLAKLYEAVTHLSPEKRAELISSGKENSSCFSWRNCAEETYSAMNRLGLLSGN